MDKFIDDLAAIIESQLDSPWKVLRFLLIGAVLFVVFMLYTNKSMSGAIWDWVSTFWFSIKTTVDIVLTVLTLFIIVGLIYLFIKLRELNSLEYHKYKAIEVKDEAAEKKHGQWQIVQNHMASNRPAEWKLAILEADNMLEELVRKVGYEGETLGERLKSIDVSDFQSIEGAWEAHKVRNRIAHEGASYQLTEREARRVIALYEKVFKEFQYI